MDGRALPMKSAMPRVISESVVSGEVNRPTLITGFFDQVLDKGNVGFLETLRTEPRGREIVHPVADIDVPKIGKVGKHFDDPAALIFPCYAVLADQFIGGEPQCDRHAATNGFQRIFKKFPQKPYAVFQAAPVFIRAAVATPGKKIHRHGDVVAAIETDQVEAGIPGTEDGVAVPTSKLANIIEVHGTRLNGVMTAGHRRVRRPEWNFARLVVGKRRGIADKFDAGQCTMIVHRIGPVPHAYDVILIP